MSITPNLCCDETKNRGAYTHLKQGYRSHPISQRLLLNEKTLGFLASGGEEFDLGPEMRLDCSELLCNKVLLKYKGDRESF